MVVPEFPFHTQYLAGYSVSFARVPAGRMKNCITNDVNFEFYKLFFDLKLIFSIKLY